MSVSGVFECYSKPVTVLDYNALKDHPLIDATTIGLKGSPTNILTSFTPPAEGRRPDARGQRHEDLREARRYPV